MENLIRAFFNLLNQEIFQISLYYVKESWFIWLPPLLAYLFWTTWLNYIRIAFISRLSWTLLEIKIPREIVKSPKAMELILNAIHNTRSGNLLERYWQGFLKAWYSLEIISVGGQIHFFVYTQSVFRNFVEAQIYAQYPGAEIIAVEDYSQAVSPRDIKEEGERSAWGAEFYLVKEDAYPIRTYADFGLEAGKTKEEEKTDPLTSFLEAMGSLKEGEEIWFQILIRAADKTWKEKADAVIESLRLPKAAPGEEGDSFSRSMLSPGQREVLLAVERNVAKLSFETGIRMIYIAKKDVFTSERKSIIVSAMKQYSTQNMNSFKAQFTSADYFFVKLREGRKKRNLLRAYQKRSWFYIPYRRKAYVLNTEALATIYHFPGRVAETPTLGRIEAKKGEPPINLPV
jgi:hypothetical protein